MAASNPPFQNKKKHRKISGAFLFIAWAVLQPPNETKA
jgi:hypothetical protein